MEHLARVYEPGRKLSLGDAEARVMTMAVTMDMTTQVNGRVSALEKKKSLWVAGAMFSSVSGILSGIAGLTIAACSLMGVISKGSQATTVGTVLIALAFPLMFLTGHCMDGIDRVKHEIRAEQSK